VTSVPLFVWSDQRQGGILDNFGLSSSNTTAITCVVLTNGRGFLYCQGVRRRDLLNFEKLSFQEAEVEILQYLLCLHHSDM